jgi:hypothetical protein
MKTYRSRQPPPRLTAIPILHVELRGGEIVVTSSDADYAVTYHRPVGSHGLIAKSCPRKEDRRVPMTLAEFLTAAWKLANNQARELGWIV